MIKLLTHLKDTLFYHEGQIARNITPITTKYLETYATAEDPKIFRFDLEKEKHADRKSQGNPRSSFKAL